MYLIKDSTQDIQRTLTYPQEESTLIFKNGPKTLADISPEKIHRWQIKL